VAYFQVGRIKTTKLNNMNEIILNLLIGVSAFTLSFGLTVFGSVVTSINTFDYNQWEKETKEKMDFEQEFDLWLSFKNDEDEDFEFDDFKFDDKSELKIF